MRLNHKESLKSIYFVNRQILLDNKRKKSYKEDLFLGAVAQLGERRVRNAEVRGSIPLSSTI